MKATRFIAAVLYQITKIAALLFLLTAAYEFVVLLLSLHTNMSGLPITVKGDSSFVIFLPFTKVPFLLGDYTNHYFLVSTITVGLYGLFLLLLSAVFKAFKQLRLFTPKNVLRLSRFYLFNVFVPVAFLLCFFLLGEEIRDTFVVVFLHLMIGVFAYFMSAIFKQGLLLQEEQDLTL